MATYYNVEGRDFIPGEKKQAMAYAQRLANERGAAVEVVVETGSVSRDPSGFVMDFEVSKRTKKLVKPKRGNPTKRAKLRRVSRALSKYVKGNPGKKAVSLTGFTGEVCLNADKTVSIVGVNRATSNPGRKKKSKFDRCVEDVESRGGAYDARGVCAAQGFRKYGKKKMVAKARAGKRRAARARARRR